MTWNGITLEGQVRTSRQVRGNTVGFEWNGGRKVTLCRGQAYSEPRMHFSITGRMPYTFEALGAAIDAWILNIGERKLADIIANWER